MGTNDSGPLGHVPGMVFGALWFFFGVSAPPAKTSDLSDDTDPVSPPSLLQMNVWNFFVELSGGEPVKMDVSLILRSLM